MKKWRTLICILIFTLTLSATVMAIDPIDPYRPVSLTVSAVNGDGVVLTGMVFDVYKVADVADFGEFTATAAFQKCTAKLNDNTQAGWSKATEIVAAYVLDQKIAPTDTGICNTLGQAGFPETILTLSQGLYLVQGRTFDAQGMSYSVSPMLVCLPDRGNDDIWDYSVSISPKIVRNDSTVTVVWKDEGYESNRPKSVKIQLLKGDNRDPYGPEVVLSAENNWTYTWTDLPAGQTWSVSETLGTDKYTYTVNPVPGGFKVINVYVPPRGTTLPQTGLLLWPIPVMAVLGVGFFTVGWIKRRRSE